MESILDSVKLAVGLSTTDTSFDDQLIMHTNTALGILTQIGIGPETGYRIADARDNWPDFLGNGVDMEFTKSYVYLKVKLLFDPPSSATVAASLEKLASELEWRLSLKADEAAAPAT